MFIIKYFLANFILPEIVKINTLRNISLFILKKIIKNNIFEILCTSFYIKLLKLI